MTALNQLEPDGLVRAFVAHPPAGFLATDLSAGIPAFKVRFDLLTTVGLSVSTRVRALPLYRYWQTLLRPKTLFIGTTVSEYVWFDRNTLPQRLIGKLKNEVAPRYPLLIIKDIPQSSPLLGAIENAYADAIVSEAAAAGFVIVQGQALAYVPIDFDSIETYLSRLSAVRRKNLRRKLRARSELEVEVFATGSAAFDDADLRAELYRLYLNVYQQSELKFDLLSPEFLTSLLRARDDRGIVFMYRHNGELIGYNLCYVRDDRLVDKYIGFAYPHARQLNLYFVSWIHNLEYALENGLKTYVAGWTDPQVKMELGALFTFTRHAVYVRNRVLRAILRATPTQFESDRTWRDVAKPDHS